MANKAKHAFGDLEKVDSALSGGQINAFDILFLKDKNGKPYVGWIDKSGNKVIVDDSVEFERIESELLTKVTASDVQDMIVGKVDSVEVDTRINQAMTDSVANAKAYTDGKVESAVAEHLQKKYEISNTPVGTLVNYGEKEIRVMCPESTVWTKQAVGATGNANMYYMAFKAYAPEGAVSFKEGDRGTIVDEMFTFEDEFAGVDEYGRKYSICWLALASYDEASDTWSYFGKNSSANKYIGWTYVVEWYDKDGIVIASDCIRINLSNEQCHTTIEPYYMSDIIKTLEAKIAESSAIKVVEF